MNSVITLNYKLVCYEVDSFSYCTDRTLSGVLLNSYWQQIVMKYFNYQEELFNWIINHTHDQIIKMGLRAFSFPRDNENAPKAHIRTNLYGDSPYAYHIVSRSIKSISNVIYYYHSICEIDRGTWLDPNPGERIG